MNETYPMCMLLPDELSYFLFLQVGTGTLQDSGVLGYREEGAMELRSSTEELQFMEPGKRDTEKEMPQAPVITILLVSWNIN